MAATTPIYGWDYQTLSDPPNGATLGQNLALDAEATVAGIDARLVLAEADVALRYRATQVVSSAVAAVTFTSIPTTLRKLEITWTARSTTAAVAANLRMRVNNDSSANYNQNFSQQNNATVTSTALATTFWQVGVITGATASANNFGGGDIVIPAWNAPHANINHRHNAHIYESAPNSWLEWGGGLYFAAGPYNRIDFFCDAGNIDVNSQFLVLGWI